MHRKRLTMYNDYACFAKDAVVSGRLSALTQDFAMLTANLRRRFALFLCRAFRFADRDHYLCLLPRKLATTRRSAAASNLCKIFTHRARESDSFTLHPFIVSRLC
jgi:hypothetical protein